MRKTLQQIKALSDGNRLRIVMALSACDELCVCQITELLQVSMPTVSRHMSVLQNAGLVENRKDARWVYYRLASGFPDALLNWVRTSVEGSEVISEDRQALEAIVAHPIDEICRVRKLGKDSKRAI